LRGFLQQRAHLPAGREIGKKEKFRPGGWLAAGWGMEIARASLLG